MKLSTGDIFKDIERWHKMYINHIKAQDFSKNSIILYEHTNLSFLDYLYECIDDFGINDINEINGIVFSNFLSYLEDVAKKRGKPLNVEGTYLLSTTKASYLKGLRSFFNFISLNSNEEISYAKYFSSIRIGKPSEAKREFLNEDEIQRLVAYLEKEKKKGKEKDFRNALLIKVMVFGGLRISEALNLKLKDFTLLNEDNVYKMTIYGKGGYRQQAYVEQDVIREELLFFEKSGMLKDSYLMVSNKGNILDRTNVYTMVNLIYKKCLIPKRGLHTLRHSIAMRFMRNGVDISTTQKFLRQKSITSTQIYAKAEESDIVDAFVKISASTNTL